MCMTCVPEKHCEFLLCLLYIFAKFAKSNKTCMNSEKMRWYELPERCLMAVFMLLTVMLPARLQASREASGC